MVTCDQPFNKRIRLPMPLSDADEVGVQVLRNKLKGITEEYVSSSNGARLSNLKEAEKEGLRSVTRKIKDKELVVYQTDKSNRLSVDTPENYKRASLVHVEHDAQISEFEAEGIEKDISAHSEAWSRILGIGSNWNQTDRVREKYDQ